MCLSAVKRLICLTTKKPRRFQGDVKMSEAVWHVTLIGKSEVKIPLRISSKYHELPDVTRQIIHEDHEECAIYYQTLINYDNYLTHRCPKLQYPISSKEGGSKANPTQPQQPWKNRARFLPNRGVPIPFFHSVLSTDYGVIAWQRQRDKLFSFCSSYQLLS